MDDILVEPHDGWRKLILNRPAKLNAVNAAMLPRLLAAIDAAEADASCRAVVLTGAGRGFCAGQELGAGRHPRARTARPICRRWRTRYHHEVVRRMRGSRLPFICAVNGVAAGAGASFALAGDIVLAARSATFMQAFIRIGLVPDSGASFFLSRCVGDARARALAMLGDAIERGDRRTLGDDLESRGRRRAGSGSRGTGGAAGAFPCRRLGRDQDDVRRRGREPAASAA